MTKKKDGSYNTSHQNKGRLEVATTHLLGHYLDYLTYRIISGLNGCYKGNQALLFYRLLLLIQMVQIIFAFYMIG